MINVSHQGPCSLVTAKYHTHYSVKRQKEQWVEKTMEKEKVTCCTYPKLQGLDLGVKTQSPLPQERQQMIAIQKQHEQRWELAELIKAKDATEPGEIAEPLPSPLLDLLHALHIEPPCFATPEQDEDIASTPPTSPTMHLNHMALCVAPNDLVLFVPNNKQTYITDNQNRIHAPTQTTNDNIYIP